MKALINNKTGDVIEEWQWLDWFGPNGESLTGYMGYRLVDDYVPDGPIADPAPIPASQRTEDPRISQLEAEIAAIREGRA